MATRAGLRSTVPVQAGRGLMPMAGSSMVKAGPDGLLHGLRAGRTSSEPLKFSGWNWSRGAGNPSA